MNYRATARTLPKPVHQQAAVAAYGRNRFWSIYVAIGSDAGDVFAAYTHVQGLLKGHTTFLIDADLTGRGCTTPDQQPFIPNSPRDFSLL